MVFSVPIYGAHCFLVLRSGPGCMGSAVEGSGSVEPDSTESGESAVNPVRTSLNSCVLEGAMRTLTRRKWQNPVSIQLKPVRPPLASNPIFVRSQSAGTDRRRRKPTGIALKTSRSWSSICHTERVIINMTHNHFDRVQESVPVPLFHVSLD